MKEYVKLLTETAKVSAQHPNNCLVKNRNKERKLTLDMKKVQREKICFECISEWAEV